MKINHKTKELYITIDDVVNETSFTSKDLSDKLGEQFDRVIERELSRAVYRYLHGLRRGFDNDKQTRVLNALIFNNKNYQRGLKLAMIEMVKGAMYTGMDLNAYSAEVAKSIPDSVMFELKNAGLTDLVGHVQISDDLLADIEATYPTFDLVLGV